MYYMSAYHVLYSCAFTMSYPTQSSAFFLELYHAYIDQWFLFCVKIGSTNERNNQYTIFLHPSYFFFQSAGILLVTSLCSEGGVHTYNLVLLPDHGTYKPASTYAISALHNSQI